jgi:hypothetical protein
VRHSDHFARLHVELVLNARTEWECQTTDLSQSIHIRSNSYYHTIRDLNDIDAVLTRGQPRILLCHIGILFLLMGTKFDPGDHGEDVTRITDISIESFIPILDTRSHDTNVADTVPCELRILVDIVLHTQA